MQRFPTVMAVLVLAGITGCMIDEKRYNPPYACLNTTLPTDAPPKITFSGTVMHPASGNPVEQATVGVYYDSAPNTTLSETTSDTKGGFALSQGFGPVAPAAFLKAKFNAYLETRYYPAAPPTGDVHVDLLMFSTTEVGTYGVLAGIPTPPGIDLQKAIFAVTVVDCNGDPVGGATVATEPPGTVKYFDKNVQPSPSATVTDGTTGTALVVNVPLDTTHNINITAKVDDKVLRSHFIQADAPMLIQTDIQP